MNPKLRCVVIVALIALVFITPGIGHWVHNHNNKKFALTFEEYFHTKLPKSPDTHEAARLAVVAELFRNRTACERLGREVESLRQLVESIDTSSPSGVINKIDQRKELGRKEEKLAEINKFYSQICEIAYKAGFKEEAALMGYKPDDEGGGGFM